VNERGRDNGQGRSPRIPVPGDAEILVETFGQFLTQHAQNLSEGGMFLRSSAPAPPGARINFAIRLADGSTLVRGVGEVMWTREPGDDPSKPPGMGIRFIELEDDARELIRRLVTERRLERTAAAAATPPMHLRVRRSSDSSGHASVHVIGPGEPFGKPDDDPAAATPPEPETGPFAVPQPIPPAGTRSDADMATDRLTGSDRINDTRTATDTGTITKTGANVHRATSTAPPSGDEEPVPPAPAAGWIREELPGIDEELPRIDVDAGGLEGEPLPVHPPSRGMGFWLFAIPIGVLALAALLYGAWRQGLLPRTGGGRKHGTATTAAATEPARPLDRQPATPIRKASEPTTTAPAPPAASPARPAETAAAPSPTAATPPAPAPEPTAQTICRVTRIRSIRHAVHDGVTTVRIEGNGPIDPSQVRLTRLETPPRALVTIRGIRHPWGNPVLEVGSPALSRIRVWLHDELSPPQLYVVLDLAGPRTHARADVRDGTVVVTVR